MNKGEVWIAGTRMCLRHSRHGMRQRVCEYVPYPLGGG